jgi:hypothetical protein
VTRPSVTGDRWGWWYRIVAYFVVALFLVIGISLMIGPPRWTHGNSLQILHDHAAVPWPVWGGAFVVLAAGIAVPPSQYLHARWVASFLSAGLAAWFIGLSVVFSIIFGKFSNPITTYLAFLAVPLLLSVCRASLPPRRR